MGLFGKDLWEQVTVDLTAGTFSLKITERKKQFIIEGKIALKVPYANNVSLDDMTLKYKPTTNQISVIQVVETFKKMLEENE